MATSFPIFFRQVEPRSVASGARRVPRPVVVLLVALTGLLWAAAASAYVVVLKDGTQIITTKKPEVDGERVLLTMRNGTTTFYDAQDVDFEETERINADGGLEGATLIQDTVLEVENEEPPEIDTSLSDVVGGRGLSLPEPKKRQARSESGPTLPTTAAGYVDLVRLERKPLADAEVSSEVTSYLTGQGHTLSVFEGVGESAPLLEIRTNTESEVFKGIRDSASALVQLNQSFPERVQSLDILFLTDKGIRGGQFSMTLEQAQMITSGRIEPQLYFLRYVEY